MRELKFRGWANSAFVYFDVRDDNDFNFYDFYSCCEPNDIEQYTGLKDKNDKEIYEGDIVEQFVCGVHQFKGKKCGRSTVWQVRWDEKECCFELHYLNGSLFGDSMMSDDDEYEVIGNVHEDADLLEEEE